MRGTTRFRGGAVRHHQISIHVPREGDDSDSYFISGSKTISIHVPREGDDSDSYVISGSKTISIHAPLEGDDWIRWVLFPRPM